MRQPVALRSQLAGGRLGPEQAAAAGGQATLLQAWVVHGVGGEVRPAVDVLLGLAGVGGGAAAGQQAVVIAVRFTPLHL